MQKRAFKFRTWLIGSLLTVVTAVAGFFCYVAWFCLKAEENLIAISEATILVVDHLEKTDGEWPRSWAGLPDNGRLRQSVLIDFEADPDVLAKQTAEEFQAIRQQDSLHSIPFPGRSNREISE